MVQYSYSIVRQDQCLLGGLALVPAPDTQGEKFEGAGLDVTSPPKHHSRSTGTTRSGRCTSGPCGGSCLQPGPRIIGPVPLNHPVTDSDILMRQMWCKIQTRHLKRVEIVPLE